MKALDENRRIINNYQLKLKRPKISFTHILLWAIVRSLMKYPHLNDAFTLKDGKPYRIKRKSINVGLAVDITKSDGSRLLLVPNVKDAQDLHFSEFVNAFNDIIEKSRTNKLSLDDLAGTSITLTNPGMIGTTHSSPRLMKHQGMIIATGSIDYPIEFQAVRPEMLTDLAVSKVVTITNTYDHRIIQGAESAEFLAYLNKLLLGEKHFYDQIFASLKIPFEPVRWNVDASNGHGLRDSSKDEMVEKGAHVMLMINAYRVRGHLLASTNPLGFQSYYYPELDPAYYGFTIWDLDRYFHADDAWEKNNLPLREIIEMMRETYCGSIGVEFMHIQDPQKKKWIKQTLESTRTSREFSKDDKKYIYKKLSEAEMFENFLHTKYLGHKRFSLEGSESVIVFLDSVLQKTADNSLNSVVLGMAHRGRLNVLMNIFDKHPEDIFKEFDDDIDPQLYQGSGDVKYHLGDEAVFKSNKGNEVPIKLAPNPSHLEFVNPVIVGMARAEDNEFNDRTYSKTLPLLVHGDAAFAGQGIVAETLNLSELEGYKTGGSVHMIVNNQIGFTTTIEDARSTVYATDIAKMIQVPIIHVNGDDPEAVFHAAELAFDYRNKFNSDVIVDILGYRKYGHNEADEPSYTQPLLYKKIKSMTPVRKKYEDELINQGIIDKEEAENIRKEYDNMLSNAFSKRKEHEDHGTIQKKMKEFDPFDGIDTTVGYDDLQKLGRAITDIPEDFDANKKVVSLFKKRRKMIESADDPIDWPTAESLAFGSILLDGNEIRFSGEDSRRGTFSQRHSVLTDISTEEEYVPLNHIQEKQAMIRIFDSPLSELGVLGFEYGYSVIARDHLTLWEAQYGDFVNVSQPIIDQFISCAERKWGQVSNLVMLLPHGYDGQGPEHSSARLERFLQLCAENNMFVGNFTTPAQYFHALRRQVLMEEKKPMILMTPKSMLRNPRAVSHLNEFSEGKFNELIDDEEITKNKVRRVLLCTGKIYYDLLEKREKDEIDDIAIVRVEQIYPLHEKLLKKIITSYKNAKEVAWVQEEPENMGAWQFIFKRLYKMLPKSKNLNYYGREERASTATGSYKVHVSQQEKIVNDAFE